MIDAYSILIWAVSLLAAVLALFVGVLVSRRLAGGVRRRAWRRAERIYGRLVSHVAAGTARADQEELHLRADALAWAVLDDLTRAALKEAGPGAARRLKHFAAQAGLLDRCRRALHHRSAWERSRAATRLADYRCAEALPDLLHATEDSDATVRTAAVRALGRLGDDAAIRVLADVLARVHSGGDRLSVRVISGNLARFGPEAGDLVLPLLTHPAWRVRGAALFVMGEVDAARHSGAIMERLADAEPDVRAKAAHALGKMRVRGALYPLLGRLEDPAWLVRMHTARALGRLADQVAVDALARCLTDAHWRVRQEAAHALAAIGGPALDVLTATVLSGHDRFAREQVVEELQRTTLLTDVINRLENAWLDELARSQDAALLAAVAEAGAVSVIISALAGHPSAHVQRALVRLLMPVANARIDAALAQSVSADPDMMVRHDAAHALKQRAPNTDVA